MSDNNIVKPTSFRVNETDIEKFKAFASENNMNQQEAFNSLINVYEMSKAKSFITDRAKDVEVFQDTINNLMSMFINSLAVNQTSEERIRTELSLELNTKDQTIKDLQDERLKLKESFKGVDESNKEFVSKNKGLAAELLKLQNELELKVQSDKNQQEQINTLNKIVAEYQGYKDSNLKLEEDNRSLLSSNSSLATDNKQLLDKINNNADMIIFYKNSIDILTKDTENYKQQVQASNEEIKTLELEHKKDLSNLKVEYDSTLAKELKLLEERLSEKNKLELDKKDLEIQKLQTTIGQLSPKVAKDTKQPTKPVNRKLNNT